MSPKSPSKPPARPYQVEGARFLRDRGRAFLGDEAGLGKSRQLLEAASGTTLIVAPAMVLDGGNWDDQVSEWAPDDLEVYQRPYSGMNARMKTGRKGKNGQDIYGVSTALHPSVKDLGRIETLILDEAHYVKGRGTSWTGAAQAIARQADQVFLATGTPIPNWPHELFVPLQLLFPEEARRGGRFGSYWRWVGEWFWTAPSPFRAHETDILGMRRCASKCADRPPTDPCDHYREFVAANLGDRFLQRWRDEVLTDLPPLTQVKIECPMTPRQYTEYRSMRDEFVAESANGTEVVAWSSGAKNVLLDRMTTGLGVLDGGLPSSAESGKLKRLEFDLSSRSRPTLVVAHYRATVEASAQVARSFGLRVETIHGGTSKTERLARVRAFQSGALDCLCGSLETIAEGLTLTAADMTIFVEKSYKPSRNEQAIRRIHRLGQQRPCTVLDYVAVTPRGGKTLDVTKRELLTKKTDVQMRVLTAAQFATLL